nr:unnamed protein product [Callosobruchus analis]
MLLPTPWKFWTILCCLYASIALVHSAVLAQLARANQARVVARQTTQRQLAQARAAAAATAARTRAQALLGPGARLGLARHGGILGDAQRVTRGSGDFFNEETVPIQEQNTFNNDIEDGSNRATTENQQVLLDEQQLGATMDQEAFGARENLLPNEGVDTDILQEPGATCGCKRRMVIIPEETGRTMRQSSCFTVLSDSPVEARMVPDQSQDIQGFDTEPQMDEETEVERTHLIHKLIHKKLHKSEFQQVQGPPINVHVTQHQNLATISRAASSEIDETEADAEFTGNQQEAEIPLMDAQDDDEVGAERFHHVHDLIHKKLHKTQQPALQNVAQTPINIHVTQNQHGVLVSRSSSADRAEGEEHKSSERSQQTITDNDQVDTTKPKENQGQNAEQVTTSQSIIGPVSEDKTDPSVTTSRPRPDAPKTDTPKEQVGSIFSNDEQVGLSPSTPSTAPVDKPGSQNEHVAAATPNEELEDEEKVGAPTPNEQSDQEEEVGTPNPTTLSNDESVGAFLHHDVHKGVFVSRPIVHHGFDVRPAGVILHNQHSFFGLRSSSGEEDGSAAIIEQSNNRSIPVQTDRPSETSTMKLNNNNNEDTKLPEGVAQSDVHQSTPIPSETENKNQSVSTTPMSVGESIDQTTEQLGAERTAHLIHKIHNKLHGPPQTPPSIPVNIHIVQNQQAIIPHPEAPSSARHFNHGFIHRHEHIHSTGTLLPSVTSLLNNLSGGTSSNVNVIQNQNANVSPQHPSAITNVNVVQNQDAAVGPQRPTIFIPSSNVEVFQNQNAAVAPARPFLSGGGSINVEVFQNQNAAFGPQMTSGFVPDQNAVILPSTSHVGGIGTQGYHQGLPSIQKPIGHVGGHTSLFQSQSATIGRKADDKQAMEDIDVPDVELRKGNLEDGDDSDAESDEVVATYLHPHDPYYDNDNPDKTKVIDLIEDKKRIIAKMIDGIKAKHDKILDSLKPKLQVKKHKQYYQKPQHPEEPLYHQYPSYAHDYNDQVPDVSWEYDPSYRANSREESDTSISADNNSMEIEQEERNANEDKPNDDSDKLQRNLIYVKKNHWFPDSLRFVRSTKVNLDNLLKKEESAVADLKKYVKRDEDLMMIDYVAEKMIDDINKKHGPRRMKRQIVADGREFQRILTDPNTKLDMTKTLENVGTVAREAIEHQRAPLYHFRNAVGSVRDAVVATMKIPNQNFIIPAQYEIVNQQDIPQLASRFGGENDKCSDDPVTDTFQKVGSVVRSTIKSGQEAIGHIGQAANHARTAIHTTHRTTPVLRLAKIPARVQTPKLSSRMGGDETVGEPKNFVNLGRIMDAVGISNPDSTVGSESIVFVPRSRMVAMRNRFRMPQPEPPKTNQQDPVVGATMKNLREAQQAVGAHSLGDLLKRMRDGLQGFVGTKELFLGSKLPNIGSRSSIPMSEVHPEQPKKSTNLRKSSNVTQTERSVQDEVVGSGLPLAPELLHPFMNRATSDQEKKFLDMFNANTRNQRSNDEHLGDVLGAINPIMFQRVFQEKLKTENSTDENTPHGVFHHHHDGHSHGEHEVTDQNEKSENVSTSMKIQGVFLKPFMGQPSKKNKEEFFSKFQRSSNDEFQQNSEKEVMDDASALQSIDGNDHQDVV